MRLQFNSTEEFDTLFKNKSIEVTRAIIQGIESAMHDNRRTAQLFEIEFVGADNMYEISLPFSQWVQALESCLDHLHKSELTDEQIDCWKLLETVKAW